MNHIEFLADKIAAIDSSAEEKQKFFRVIALASETELAEIVALVKEDDSLIEQLFEDVLGKYQALQAGDSAAWQAIMDREKAYLETR